MTTPTFTHEHDAATGQHRWTASTTVWHPTFGDIRYACTATLAPTMDPEADLASVQRYLFHQLMRVVEQL